MNEPAGLIDFQEYGTLQEIEPALKPALLLMGTCQPIEYRIYSPT